MLLLTALAAGSWGRKIVLGVLKKGFLGSNKYNEHYIAVNPNAYYWNLNFKSLEWWENAVIDVRVRV